MAVKTDTERDYYYQIYIVLNGRKFRGASRRSDQYSWGN